MRSQTAKFVYIVHAGDVFLLKSKLQLHFLAICWVNFPQNWGQNFGCLSIWLKTNSLELMICKETCFATNLIALDLKRDTPASRTTFIMWNLFCNCTVMSWYSSLCNYTKIIRIYFPKCSTSRLMTCIIDSTVILAWDLAKIESK